MMTAAPHRMLLLVQLLLLALAVPVSPAAQRAPSADEILAKARATYAGLTSYSDTGTVMTEAQWPGAPMLTERHSFVTRYKGPRQYWFDFRKDPKAGQERFVVWGDGADFHTWWSATTVHDVFPPGQGATAFAISSGPTHGAAMQLAPLLFSQAGLQGPLTAVAGPRLSGTDTLDGEPAYRLVAEVAQNWSSGNAGRARTTTVWVDTRTFLILRVLEDTPAGTGSGTINRITTSFRPIANPALPPDAFQFTPPN